MPFLHSLAAILIVATGMNNDESKHVMKTEVLNLDNPSITCKPWGDSEPLEFPTGGFFSNGLTVCGGRARGEDPTNKCFQIRQNITIPFNVSQGVASYGSSGVMINQKEFLISGGTNTDETLLKRSGILTTTAYLEGTDLPFPSSYHCIIATGNGTIFSTGGKSEYNGYTDIPCTYTLVWDKSTWKNTSTTLNQARFKHACGSFILNGTTFLVVAGGSDDDTHSINTTEFLSLDEENSEWVYGNPNTYLNKVVQQFNFQKISFLSFC